MKLVYLIGAGASADSLPLAATLGNHLREAVEEFRKSVELHFDSPGNPYPEEKRPWPGGPYAKDLLEGMTWLSQLADKHATVDTLARKYWFRGSEGRHLTNRLKAVLACYFIYAQSFVSSDKRYDSFFASILRRGGPPKLPEDVVILSWNYDSLILKSYREFCSDAYFDHEEDHPLKACVCWLNGRAGALKPYDFYSDALYTTERLEVEEIVDLYEKFLTDDQSLSLHPGIEFAWEESSKVETATMLCSGATILVVIGYSFPNFNYDIDAQLINQMAPSLNRIILQTRQDIGPHERLKAILTKVVSRNRQKPDIEIVDLAATDYFHIPNEFAF